VETVDKFKYFSLKIFNRKKLEIIYISFVFLLLTKFLLKTKDVF